MVGATRLRSTHCRLQAFAVDNGVDGAFRLSQERPAVGCLQVAALGALHLGGLAAVEAQVDGPLPDGPDPACSRARHCPN